MPQQVNYKTNKNINKKKTTHNIVEQPRTGTITIREINKETNCKSQNKKR